MLFRAFLLLTGFGLTVSGGISTIAYLNLLTTGIGFLDYLVFISNRLECTLLPLGVFMIWISVYFPKKVKK